MTKRNWAIFDYDGTLGGFVLPNGEIGNALEAYMVVISRFVRYMTSLGFDPAEAMELQQEIDCAAAGRHGFSNPARFPNSFGHTYNELCARTGRKSEYNIWVVAVDIGWQIFSEFPYVPLPGALNTLKAVGEEYNIAIVTKGNDEIQRQKIEESGVEKYADQIFVLGHKSLEEWRWVFHNLEIDGVVAQSSWAIGDSIKSDVNPPHSLGMNGIHIDGKENWQFEAAEIVAPTYHGTIVECIKTIGEVPSILSTLNI